MKCYKSILCDYGFWIKKKDSLNQLSSSFYLAPNRAVLFYFHDFSSVANNSTDHSLSILTAPEGRHLINHTDESKMSSVRSVT